MRAELVRIINQSRFTTHSFYPNLDSELIESPYQIYGRLPTTPSSRGGSRGYISSNSRMYIGDWE